MTYKFGYSNDTIKSFLERMEKSAVTGLERRAQLRHQLMALTLTISVSMIGFALSRDNQHTASAILMLVPIFCLFMHGLDAWLSDLNERQTNRRWKLNECLLGSEMWDETARLEALRIGFGSLEPKDRWKKIRHFFCGGFFEAFWHWGLFIGTLAIYVAFEFCHFTFRWVLLLLYVL